MLKYSLALLLVVLFSNFKASAQIASGNVAESSHPRADALLAQNSPSHRTLKGCVTRSADNFLLSAGADGQVGLLAGGNTDLSALASQRVKVSGRMASTLIGDPDNDTSDEVFHRELTVERVQKVAGACR